MIAEIISTERLVLRPVRASDPDKLHRAVFSDPQVMSQAFAGRTFTRRESAEFIGKCFDHDGNGKQPGVLALIGSGEVVGFAGLLECSALGRPDYEIGFVLARKHWGKGYATEIGIAQIEYGLDAAGCARLLALVSPDNLASRSAIHKIGMIHHSTIDTETRGRKEIYVTRSDTSQEN